MPPSSDSVQYTHTHTLCNIKTREAIIFMKSSTSTPPPPPQSILHLKSSPDDNDDEVDIVAPPETKRPRMQTTNESESDDIEVLQSNLSNPLTLYPHPRHTCAVHVFHPSAKTNEAYCPKCYCFVCDMLASECEVWVEHCNAHDKDIMWVARRASRMDPSVSPNERFRNMCAGEEGEGEVVENAVVDLCGDEGDDLVRSVTQSATMERNYVYDYDDFDVVDEHDFDVVDDHNAHISLADATIAEKLMINLKKELNRNQKKRFSIKKMEGDIPQLNLASSFFVEGVKIGWPFPTIMTPQRQMAMHIVKALKNRRHVVLESPTGTGKSVAILTATLAWQRYHKKMTGEDIKIIYCSRTHSQVKQMVSSLRKTSYRPKMAILGSRERMCVHEEINPVDKQKKRFINVNTACRIRRSNTERYRKRLKKSYSYDDDLPPMHVDGDVTLDEIEEKADGNEDDSEHDQNFKKVVMCPHYRQLTGKDTASLIFQSFVPGSRVDSVSRGGEATRLGSHDIEDLVVFGRNIHTIRDIALYRNPNFDGFGLRISSCKRTNVTRVENVKEGGPAYLEGTLQVNDALLKVNGRCVKNLKLDEVTKCFGSANDLLLLDVERHSSDEKGHSACPYYTSRALEGMADLVFAPYNYVLDSQIRQAMSISVKDSVIVLDEGHNIESTLRESGSGDFDEIDLSEIVVFLMQKLRENSGQNPGRINRMDAMDESDSPFYSIHFLLVFVEKIVLLLRKYRSSFETTKNFKTGKSRADVAIQEWHKFRTPNDKKHEMLYVGPKANSGQREPQGCKPIFEKLNIDQIEMEKTKHALTIFDQELKKKRRQANSPEGQRNEVLVDRLASLVSLFESAFKSSEHYYCGIGVMPNGSYEFAAGIKDHSSSKPKPKKYPFQNPRTESHPERIVYPCPVKNCKDVLSPEQRESLLCNNGYVRHGNNCDGTSPKWIAVLSLNLLTPGPLMQELAESCRNIIIASGSLAPIHSLVAELNLFPPSEKRTSIPTNGNDETKISKTGRLQIRPRPLEANHVVDLEKQLLAVSIGHFRDGSQLTVNYRNYKEDTFLYKLGDAIVGVIESIPKGGVLIFLPSYSLLKKCHRVWNPDARYSQHSNALLCDNSGQTVWDRLISSKGKCILEPTEGGQAVFESKRNEYTQMIRDTGNCVLFAVFRGKMSEGVSFNDENARGVICVGIPFPSALDRTITAKRAYNDEQRRLRGRTDLLPGQAWYAQQAYRALAQALGRCIRHAADYGTIVLLDSRHCDGGGAFVDGVCLAHKNFPKWMRHHIKNVNKGNAYNNFHESRSIAGWAGLKTTMKAFFSQAPAHCEEVLSKQKESLKAAKERLKEHDPSSNRYFDRKKGVWSEKRAHPIKKGKPK